jgi:hypothetical protein
MYTRLTAFYLSAQKGAALVVSMVMLLVITVIGIAVMGGSRLELLMANNSHLQTDAQRNAEIALAAGLDPPSINNPPTLFPPPPSSISTLSPQDLADVTKWSDGTITGTPVTTATGSAAYVVEYLGCSKYNPTIPLSFLDNVCGGSSTSFIFALTYRVWALGTDGKGAARILKSTRTLINNQVIPTYSGLPGIKAPGEFPPFDNRVELPQ